MTVSSNLRNRYEAMDTDQLSELYVSGGLTGLTENAEEILCDVLKSRGVVPEELLLFDESLFRLKQNNKNKAASESILRSSSERILRMEEKLKEKGKEYSVNSQSSGNSILYISSALMLMFGIFISYTLISKANSGWGGIDEKLIVMGMGVFVYQSIIAYLCYKVADLEGRINSIR